MKTLLAAMLFLWAGTIHTSEPVWQNLPSSERLTLAPSAAPVLTLARQSVEERHDFAGEPVSIWKGYVEGDPLSRAVLTTRRGITAGLITTSQGTWQVTPSLQGSRLELVDLSQGIPCETSSEAESAADTPQFLPHASSTPPIIDVFVFYSPASRDAAGGVAAIEAAIANAIDVGNDAFVRSKITASLRLIGTGLLPVSVPQNQDPLLLLHEHPAISAHRNAVKADLVSAIVESSELPNMCGKTAQFTGEAQYFINVVRRTCISFALPHEIGHQMGLHHQPEDTPPPNTHPTWLPDVGYAHYRCKDGASDGWITIMAGGRLPCVANSLAPHFSNPHVIYQGFPTGIENQRDNARVANLTAPVVAGFRGCSADAVSLCLNDSRFRIMTWYWTPQVAQGTAFAVQLTPDTGYFWFFSAVNVEVFVKVLNACTLNNRFWVFSAGLTNLNVQIMVEDTKTGEIHYYSNPRNTPFQPILDTNAFATCP